MQHKLSRRKLALHVVEAVKNGTIPADTLRQAAAYLIDAGRTREVVLVARAIEDELAERGVVVATVTSAGPLDDVLRQAVTSQVAAKTVALKEVIDPSVLGGVRIDMPGKRLDATISRKLTMLRSAKQ